MKMLRGNKKREAKLPVSILPALDYFEGAGALLSVVLDEAEESAAFLDFLLLFFLLEWPGLVGLLVDAEDAAGEEEVSDEAGAWANAETANRPATRVAISFFMFNPLRNGEKREKATIRANQFD